MRRLLGGTALALIALLATAVPAAAVQDPAAAEDPATDPGAVIEERYERYNAYRDSLPETLQEDIEDCDTLASRPPGSSRADPGAIEKWSRCLELLEGSNWSDGSLETEWYGVVARTEHAAVSSYRVHYDAGAWDHWSRKVQGWQMETAWGIGTWLLSLAVWAFDWVVNSRMTDLITGIADELRTMLMDSGLLGGLFGPIAILASCTAAAISVIRKRTSEGIGHLVWLAAVIAVGVMLVAESDTLYGEARKFRTDLSEIATDPAQRQAAQAPNGDIDAGLIAQPLLTAIVHEPWQQLNWGGAVPDTPECRGRMVEVLARRPSATDDWPREHMEGCPAGAKTNSHNPSWVRVNATLLISGAMLFMALVLGGLALMALGAEIALAAAFAFLPAAVVFSAFPSSGRQVASSWLTMLIKGLLGIVIGLFGLRVVLVIYTAVAEHLTAEQVPLLARFAIFLVLSFCIWRYRKKIPALTRTIAGKFGGKLVGSGGGGGGGAAGGAVAGAIGGFGLAAAASSGAGQATGLLNTARAARGTLQKVTQPVARAGAGLAQAYAPGSKTATTLGGTKAAGGTGLAMSTALAGAQLAGQRRAAKIDANPKRPNPAPPPPPGANGSPPRADAPPRRGPAESPNGPTPPPGPNGSPPRADAPPRRGPAESPNGPTPPPGPNSQRPPAGTQQPDGAPHRPDPPAPEPPQQDSQQ